MTGNRMLRSIGLGLFALWMCPSLASAADRELVPDPTDPTLWYEMLWTVVVFGVFFTALSILVWPQVLKALRVREEKQQGDLAAAEQDRETAKQQLAEYEQKLTEAHAEVRKMLDQARADADAARGKMLADAEAEAANMRKRNADEIRLAKQQAVQDLYAHAAELATAVAGKMLQRQVNDEDVQSLIDKSLDEMGKAG